MNPEFLLTAIIFLPTLGALLLAFFDSRNVEVLRFFSLGVTVVTFGLTLALLMQFQSSTAEMQMVVVKPWIPAWNVYYRLGVDGISLPLVLLTGLVSMLSMVASWSITKHVKGYMILFLLLETGMMGVFLSLDFFLFYVFWEVMLLPMYFLIG
ncbi:MAG: NADH-quinone oxidoreductase subunit M, partial [Planctomyces sp.]